MPLAKPICLKTIAAVANGSDAIAPWRQNVGLSFAAAADCFGGHIYQKQADPENNEFWDYSAGKYRGFQEYKEEIADKRRNEG